MIFILYRNYNNIRAHKRVPLPLYFNNDVSSFLRSPLLNLSFTVLSIYPAHQSKPLIERNEGDLVFRTSERCNRIRTLFWDQYLAFTNYKNSRHVSYLGHDNSSHIIIIKISWFRWFWVWLTEFKHSFDLKQNSLKYTNSLTVIYFF